MQQQALNLGHLSPQNEIILRHLIAGGTLTAREAVFAPFNTTCLHKRLSEIEATGIHIDSVWEGNGKKRWKRYSFHKAVSQLPLTGGLGAEPLTDFAGVVWYPCEKK